MWTSLEIVKVVVAGTTPLAVAVLAALFSRALKRAETRQWFSQKLVEKRIELLGTALPALNDLYCYFTWVGAWKELTPPEMLARKRSLDRLFRAYAPFFSPAATSAYDDFISVLFMTFVAPGASARLRTGITSGHGNRKSAFAGHWEPGWDGMFVADADQTRTEVVQERYRALTTVLGAEVGARSLPGGGSS